MLTSTHDSVRGPGGRASSVARQARVAGRIAGAGRDERVERIELAGVDADLWTRFAVIDAHPGLARDLRCADPRTSGPTGPTAEVAHASAARAAGLHRRAGRRFGPDRRG